MEEAFLQIVDENQNIIHKISRMYRDTSEDQEDLFQEIIFHLWKGYPGFRGDSKVSSWIYRIALNTAISTFRRKRPDVEYQAGIREEFHPRQTQEVSENEERMYAVLRQLNSGEKALISLYLEDYSYKEIASIIGINENNVGVRINRIKNKLKTILNR